ncbi:hypothetical protein MASR2M17_11040 [Aminivibrio sp.]
MPSRMASRVVRMLAKPKKRAERVTPGGTILRQLARIRGRGTALPFIAPASPPG